MGSLNAAETLAKSSGDLYTAPAGTGAPAADGLDHATLTTGAWVHNGWLDEDGPKPDGFGGETTKHYGWNRTAPARVTTRRKEPTVGVGLLQWNVENLQSFFPGATYDAPSKTLTVAGDGEADPFELLTVVRDGTRSIGLWIAVASVRGDGGFEFPGDGLTTIPVVYDVLAADDGEDFKFIGVELADGNPA